VNRGFPKSRVPDLDLLVACGLFWVLASAASAAGATADASFRTGIEAYRAGDYSRAATAFHESSGRHTAPGTLQNLGNAEWQRGRVGAAILAWEQALWLDPSGQNARNNLRYAREIAQLEAPELGWHEIASSRLPPNWWAWIAAASLWLVAGMIALPPVLRWRKAGRQQALAALGLAVFLLCIPAEFGVYTRSHIGFVLHKDTPLRLTPTLEGEAVTRLAAGEPARLERTRGNYLYIRTSRAAGWVERGQFGLVCGE
jgi:tetratricopeptide (TPR) repeat protein